MNILVTLLSLLFTFAANMPSLQKKYTDRGVVWLTIISSAPGKQGYVDEAGAAKQKKENASSATDVLLDPAGKVGRLYGAKTTPHMFIVDQEGVLRYQGAIDDKADTDVASIPHAKNYVAKALDELLSGKKVMASTTKSYGCSVKY